MPLIRDEGISAHHWRLAGPEDDLAHAAQVIAPYARLDELLDGRAGVPVGLALPNDADLAPLSAHVDAIQLITVAFPAFSDGRGFSLAKRIRALGYEGELWAAGHLIPDQYAFARSCGFDAVLVDEAVFERQTESDWQGAAHSLSLAYQSGTAGWEEGPRSILELRRAARAALAAE